jgi:hypothetical protein
MRDPSVPCPPDPDTSWPSADLALNHAARLHAESVIRMQVAGAQLASQVRHAVDVQQLSVERVAVLTGLERQLISDLVGARKH